MKNTTKANIFLSVGVIWFLFFAKNWLYLLMPNSPNSILVFDANATGSYIVGTYVGLFLMPFVLLIPSLIYRIKVKQQNKIVN